MTSWSALGLLNLCTAFRELFTSILLLIYGTIHLVRKQIFLKNYYFLPLDYCVRTQLTHGVVVTHGVEMLGFREMLLTYLMNNS